MRSGASRLPRDERAEPGDRPEAPAPASPMLDLQRSAGNAAVARLLARQPAPNLFDPAALRLAVADHGTAVDAVSAWFDKVAEPHRESLAIPGSIAELVHEASEQPITLRDGTQAKVRDKMSAGEVEDQLRLRARTRGMRLQEHRDASDVAGVRKELSAVLANLGAIPTELSFGDDEAKVTASISGKVTAEGKLGKVKVEGEASSEGAEATVTLPGGAKVTGKGGPEGGGGSVSVPGAKFGLDVTKKGVKAEVKVGDLVTVTGGVEDQGDGVVGWRADISIGTIGKLLMPEDVAKVFTKAEETFSKSAGELARNLDDPSKVKQHGAALEGAVREAVEKAKKSASQKPGWRVGAELRGDSAGGYSGSVTLTWVFP